MSVPFHINVQGERLCAAYELDGLHLTVRSAYGSRRAVLGLAKPGKMAKALLRVILRDVVEAAPLPAAGKSKQANRSHLNS